MEIGIMSPFFRLGLTKIGLINKVGLTHELKGNNHEKSAFFFGIKTILFFSSDLVPVLLWS